MFYLLDHLPLVVLLLLVDVDSVVGLVAARTHCQQSPRVTPTHLPHWPIEGVQHLEGIVARILEGDLPQDDCPVFTASGQQVVLSPETVAEPVDPSDPVLVLSDCQMTLEELLLIVVDPDLHGVVTGDSGESLDGFLTVLVGSLGLLDGVSEGAPGETVDSHLVGFEPVGLVPCLVPPLGQDHHRPIR